jgi:hypothetical protein
MRVLSGRAAHLGAADQRTDVLGAHLHGRLPTLVFLLYQKGRDSRIFQAQDRAIDDFTLTSRPFVGFLDAPCRSQHSEFILGAGGKQSREALDCGRRYRCLRVDVQCQIVLGIRPEDLEPTVAAEGFSFTARVTEPLGPHIMLTGESVGQQVRVVVPPDRSMRVGATMHLRPRYDHVVWMDPASGVAIGREEALKLGLGAAGN